MLIFRAACSATTPRRTNPPSPMRTNPRHLFRCPWHAGHTSDVRSTRFPQKPQIHRFRSTIAVTTSSTIISPKNPPAMNGRSTKLATPNSAHTAAADPKAQPRHPPCRTVTFPALNKSGLTSHAGAHASSPSRQSKSSGSICFRFTILASVASSYGPSGALPSYECHHRFIPPILPTTTPPSSPHTAPFW
jgi:hypothetical protein